MICLHHNYSIMCIFARKKYTHMRRFALTLHPTANLLSFQPTVLSVFGVIAIALNNRRWVCMIYSFVQEFYDNFYDRYILLYILCIYCYYIKTLSLCKNWNFYLVFKKFSQSGLFSLASHLQFYNVIIEK